MTKELTPLEALSNLRDKIVYNAGKYQDCLEWLDIIKTSLKALEIIKKNIVIQCDEEAKLLIIYAKIDDITLRVIYVTHNEEEYELLKEVLK